MIAEQLTFTKRHLDSLDGVSARIPSATDGGERAEFELCAVGDFAWDVLIRTNSELLHGGDTFGEVTLLPGGSAANVAVWASRCGAKSSFVGKVGRDRMGQLAHENLANEEVTAHLVEADNHDTGSVAVFVDHTGERSMVSGHGADFFLLPSELPDHVIAKSRHLHLASWSFFTDPPRAAARRAAQISKAAGATVSLDPSSFQMIAEMGVSEYLEATTDLNVDIFLPNKQEGEILTGLTEPDEISRRLAVLYPGSMVVLKLDADGAMVLVDSVLYEVPAATNNLVDATGAGDSFAGAFLASHLVGVDPVASAKFATQVAAWVVEHTGARPRVGSRLQALIDKVHV